ncbi:adenosine deaminase [Klenkia soli]|uniref:adenosine deaminase n=1 Tax=Klenkia soli TaxID=1052260 RepID=A0A1H0IYB1_9ACTN|nr:adenosine deaminase [Klenkia soli]SDO36477.1 adenosine deaminase [Klenkia soli]
MPAPLTQETLARAPKVLLHDHLDGGLRPQTVLELADAIGYTDLPADDAESLGAWFRQAADSGSLVRYLETFAHTVAVMQTPEAVQRVARECALDLAADGVVHAEVRMAPELLTAMPVEAAVEAMLDGYAAGAREAGTIRVGALLCAMRQADRWDEVAGLVVRYRDAGVVGFDLAGPEIGFPADRHPSAIALLDDAGAHRTIHAGEADGIESIRGALDGARAERLGHGVRIADEVPEDGGPLGPVAQRVLDEQVVLEVAPSSNVQTGAYSSISRHPVGRLHRAGFAVTLNTDNRLMSGVSVSSEFAAVVDAHGWGWDDVQTVTERAVGGAFLDDGDRAQLLARVREGYAALRG